jgi:3-oxoacyl-[acyl-carrier protein] reductase
MSFEERVALVTGASQGIGKACAIALADAGCKAVVLAARNVEKLNEVAAEITSKGHEAHVVAMDLSDASTIEAAFKNIKEKYGRIDILVNNAGITRDGLVMRMKREDWDAVIASNLTGAHLCIQQALLMMVRARYGRIINVTSVVAQMGNAGQANYIASKAGLIGLTKAIAHEVASRCITVNAVAPGFIDTAMTSKIVDAAREKLISLIPLGRMGADSDIASAVRFLASDEAGYITGHVLNVNGGMFMG